MARTHPSPHLFPPHRRTVYAGTFVHLRSRTELCVREGFIVGVDEQGKIAFVEEKKADGTRLGGGHDGSGGGDESLSDEWIEEEVKRQGWGRRKTEDESEDEEGEEMKRVWELVRAGKGEWWFPGFVDTHIHASQYPNSGIFGETTLLEWLNKYTFPLEKSLSSLSKARKVYSSCVAATLRHGTTTAAYYATIHAPSTNLLASICLEAGQRAFIGRCAMDSKINPEDYRDASPAAAINDTRSTIANINSMDPHHTLVCPIITPRFAPSCSSTLLSELGTLARETSLPIQTHIAENPSEIELVAELFPEFKSYAAVYDGYRLLTPRSVLAHAVHLSSEERALIKHRGSKISHCPVSNSCISSGLCPVRQFLDEGIEVGLGTDVSGGYSPSVLLAAREAGVVSRVLSSVQRDFKPEEASPPAGDGKDEPFTSKSEVPKTYPNKNKDASHKYDRTRLTVEECLYLATVGGAHCLGLEHKIGRFDIGMEWDAQLVRLGSSSPADASTEEKAEAQADLPDEQREAIKNNSSPKTGTDIDDDDDNPVTLWGCEKWSEKMAKWVFCGDDRNIRAVWVRGKLVHRRR